MNFFGHATIASFYDRAPAFVLGAMLPDLMSMTRVRVLPQLDAAVRAGVELHHATDAVFHGNAAFLELTRGALDRLLASGVERGPARASAHIGVELLLDEIWNREPLYREAYLSGLSLADDGALPVAVADEADHERLLTLLGRLKLRAAEPRSEPRELAQRIHRSLHGRKRLSLPDDQVERVSSCLAAAQPNVESRAAGLLADVRRELDPRWQERALSLEARQRNPNSRLR